LWIVTASIIIAVLFSFDFIPSGLSLFRCKCGVKLSIISKNIIPNKNPTVAGNHVIPPCPSAISNDGISRDHIEAAIITPEAKPSNSFSSFELILFLIKNTIAEPKVVPKNGINKPKVNSILFPLFLFYFFIFLFIIMNSNYFFNA